MTDGENVAATGLPPGWAATTLGEVCLPVDKVDPTEQPDLPFKYLDITSIDNSKLRIVSLKEYVGRDAPSRARQKVQSGNTLFFLRFGLTSGTLRWCHQNWADKWHQRGSAS